MTTPDLFKPQKTSLMAAAFDKAGKAIAVGSGPAATTGQANPFQAQTDKIAAGSQYKAATTEFDESKGVAGRIDTMLRSSSPLMEAARTRAAQSSQGRGLLNSSLAVQAGQQAMIDSAAPIATQDANLFQQQGLANQAATNDAIKQNAQLRTSVQTDGMKLGESARQFNVNEANDESQFTRELDFKDKSLTEQSLMDKAKLGESARQFNVSDAGQNNRFTTELAEKSRQFNADAGLRKDLATADNQTRLDIAKLDSASRQQVAELENEWRLELSRNEKLAGAWGTAQENISKIQNNKDLNESTKQTLIKQTLDSFKGYANFAAKLAAAPIDVSDLLDFRVGGQSGGGATVGPAPAPPVGGARPVAPTEDRRASTTPISRSWKDERDGYAR